MAMNFGTRPTTSIRSVISFGCSVGFSAGELPRSGFRSVKHLTVHENGI